MMGWLSSATQIVLLLVFQQQVHALELFHPYKDDGICTASMSICSFELHATGAMTMFYKNMFRVVATNDGILHHYDNISRTFSMADILTADGYPKLVRIYFSLKTTLYFYLFSLGLCF